MAFLKAILLPALNANNPPVTPPATIWFQISYLFLIDINMQLEIENSPAQSPKLPKLIKFYLLILVLFFLEAWYLHTIFNFLERATFLWWDTGRIQQHTPSQILLPYHLQFYMDRVVIALSLATNWFGKNYIKMMININKVIEWL